MIKIEKERVAKQFYAIGLVYLDGIDCSKIFASKSNHCNSGSNTSRKRESGSSVNDGVLARSTSRCGGSGGS